LACRRMVGQLALSLGFSSVGQTMLVTAASELARNTLIYGGGSHFEWAVLTGVKKVGLRLTFSDEGPGIVDIESAMSNGWTSGRGLGLGLPGAKRLVHEFEIHSAPGQGTVVAVTRWQSKHSTH
jgi:serine/threonine-protein kinase RsbT